LERVDGTAKNRGDKVDNRLLDKIETIFLVNNLQVMHNGIISSVIRKMRFMEDEWGYNPLLLISDYNIELQRIKIMLKFGMREADQTQFNKSARILNVYDHFQRSYAPDVKEAEYGLNLGEGESASQTDDNIYEIFKDGKHIRTEYFTGLFGRLRLVERISGGKPARRIYYDDCGYISMIQHLDEANPEFHPWESYYTTDKRLCIMAKYTFTPDNPAEKNKLRRLTLFDEEGRAVKECASNAELAACCLDELCADPSKLYLIVDESGVLTSAPLAVKRKNVFRCCIVHNIFLTDAYRLDSRPQSYYAHMCEHRNEFDGIIFLTMTERTDFIKKYPGFDPRKAFVIPHPYAYHVDPVDFELRDHKKAIIIARFDDTKQIPHAVGVFKKVVEEVPDAVLEIYGFGFSSVEEKVDASIKELGLENNVKKMGYTDHPVKKMRGAAAFIMTSVVEGMPMTLVESICNGCPVFAYDINYGPADTILDGSTGFLFYKGDGTSLAAQLVKYFMDIEMQRSMSENCYKDARRFSVLRFLERWRAFMESLYSRRRDVVLKETAGENIAASEV
jgi:poly(glycerol-phosphate) alpha-glucosyltransferase